jgi:hypothetical protein
MMQEFLDQTMCQAVPSELGQGYVMGSTALCCLPLVAAGLGIILDPWGKPKSSVASLGARRTAQ